MAVRLANRKDIFKVTIDGTVFQFRAMDAGEQLEMASVVTIEKPSTLIVRDIARFKTILGRCVTSVEGFDISPMQIVNDLADVTALAQLFSEISERSFMTEEERKNSDNSSSGKPTEATPTGSSRPTLDEVAVAAELSALRGKE